jgi:ElaA protein
MNLSFTCTHFDDLSLHQLYDAMALRQEVFVVEQNCAFLDADGKDQVAYHCFGYAEDGQLHAYTRLLAAGPAYPDYASIGRVVTSAAARGGGWGRHLMQYSIAQLYEKLGVQPIKIGAQAYLENFYGSLGFRRCGENYLEDGIPHLPMLKA